MQAFWVKTLFSARSYLAETKKPCFLGKMVYD